MVYAPPNEDTVVAVGGLGTQNDSSTYNGGGATKTVWDDNSPSNFIDIDGGPIKSTANGAFNWGNKTITSVGIGIEVIVGTLCYLDDGVLEASFFTGIYEATTVADNVLTFANISLSAIDTDQSDGVICNVGGSIGSIGDGSIVSSALQEALDNSVNDAATNGVDGSPHSRYIYYNAFETLYEQTDSAGLNVDTYSGSANTKIFIIGYNSTLTTETIVTITTNSKLSLGLVRFVTVDYTLWKNIDFNAGGKDDAKAAYAVYNGDSGCIFHTFVNCYFRGASIDGFYVAASSNNWNIINCKAYLNGNYGIFFRTSNGLISNSYIYDNDSDGVYQRSAECIHNGNIYYNNGGNGLNLPSQGKWIHIINNTFYGNVNDGLSIDDLADGCVVFNNTSSENSNYGYDLQGKSMQPLSYFGYNHSYNNKSGHLSELSVPGSDSEFESFREGNNQTGDPKFAIIEPSVIDFTPVTDSPLIDNGLEVSQD